MDIVCGDANQTPKWRCQAGGGISKSGVLSNVTIPLPAELLGQQEV